MKCRTLVGIAVMMGIAALSIPQVVWAAGSSARTNASDNFRLDLGLFLPNTPDASDVAHNWFAISLAYNVLPHKPSRSLVLAPYLDFGLGLNDVSANQYDGANDSYYYEYSRTFAGVGLSATLQIITPDRKFGAYAIAGGGLYRLDYNSHETDTPLLSPLITLGLAHVLDAEDYPISYAKTVHPGFKLGGGLMFGKDVSLEGVYYGLGRLDGIEYSGVAVTVGWRL
jgi:hypothetical protein